MCSFLAKLEKKKKIRMDLTESLTVKGGIVFEKKVMSKATFIFFFNSPNTFFPPPSDFGAYDSASKGQKFSNKANYTFCNNEGFKMKWDKR